MKGNEDYFERCVLENHVESNHFGKNKVRIFCGSFILRECVGRENGFNSNHHAEDMACFRCPSKAQLLWYFFIL